MTDAPDSTTDLFAKLQALDLSPDQKKLLAAILAVAGHITEGQGRANERAFHDDFEEAFAPYPPATVALLLEYADSPPPAPPIYDMIVRGHMIVRGGPSSDTAAPPMIVRTTPPGPASGPADDDDD
jgi:hypothetical protein